MESSFSRLTDMVRGEEGSDHIRNWMRNRNTVEFLGIWEKLYNLNFKGVEFDTFKKEAGLNSFNLTPKKWVETTNAIGNESANSDMIREGIGKKRLSPVISDPPSLVL